MDVEDANIISVKSSTDDSNELHNISCKENSEHEGANGSPNCEKSGYAGESFDMIDSQDLTEQELEILRGDAVGQSAHSSQWILKILMSLCKINEFTCTKEIEEDIGLLFEASVDEDVRSFLMQHDFLKIAEYVLLTCRKPQIQGIILSIIYNLCSDIEAIDLIASNETFVIIIFNILGSKDPILLNEVLRFLKIVLHRIWWNPQSDWILHLKKCSYFRDSVINILQNSTNDDLLIETIAVLQSIFNMKSLAHASFLTQLFQTSDLIPALQACFTEIISVEQETYSYNENQIKFIKNWLDIINDIDMQILLKCSRQDLSELMNIIWWILMAEKYSMNFVSEISSEHVSLIQLLANIIYNFHNSGIDVSIKIDHALANLALNIEQASSDMNKGEQDSNVEKTMHELSNFMKDYWFMIINLCTVEQIAEMFRPLQDNTSKYLMSFIKYNPEMTSETFEKIKTVVSIILCPEF